MQQRRIPYLVLILAALLAMLLVACGGSTASSPPTSTPIPVPEAPEEQPQESAPEAAYPGEAPAAAAPAEGYPAQAGGMRTFVIVPAESSASYLADEEFFEDALDKLGIGPGLNSVVGTTNEVAGQIQVDLSSAQNALGDTMISANLAGLTTDQQMRDQWIRDNNNGPNFGAFPPATFKATSVSGLPENYVEGQEVQFQLTGDLTVREVTRPVTFDVTAAIEGGTLTGTAETQLLMSELGITPPAFARTLTVDDEFGIRVQLVAREQ
jgi:polyisoprenoid-binding protein YceI